MLADLRPPKLVTDVAAEVHVAGGRALLVGGCVRDHVLRLPLKDWDIEVHGMEADALEPVLRRTGRVGMVGRAFQVFKVRRGELEIDVSLPRRDSKQGPGHRGILAVADPTLDITEAARRRDLTINAIMLDLHTGALIDPFGGLEDLRSGLLRPVDATTFLEDPLRALRAVQFAARFGFTATPALTELCRAASLDELPAERVQGEWFKLLLRGARLAPALTFAREAHITRRVFPGVQDELTADELDRALPARDPGLHEGRALALMLLVWLHRSPPAAVAEALDRLGVFTWLNYPLRDAILTALAAWDAPTATDAELRWLSTRAEPGLVLRARAAAGDLTADAAFDQARALGVLTEKPAPLVLGRDLIALGIKPGPAMGKALQALYAQQLDGAWFSREDALQAAQVEVARVTAPP
jgi:tRNA nucleotidyltransferase (CCA-adding enzyme)